MIPLSHDHSATASIVALVLLSVVGVMIPCVLYVLQSRLRCLTRIWNAWSYVSDFIL